MADWLVFFDYREFDFDGDEAALVKELTLQVRKHIGPFASPRRVYIVNDLPKTRSGKVSLSSSAIS
jgi:acetyl-CoA synthetase